MRKAFLLAAAILGFLSVGAGAFGAHALSERLSSADLSIFETAVRYQLVHALALGLVAALDDGRPAPGLVRAGAAFGLGTLVFSGSLYVLVLTQVRWLGAITPVGGLALLAGWLFLAGFALRR